MLEEKQGVTIPKCTVAELIARLQTAPGDAVVILAADPAGNSCHYLEWVQLDQLFKPGYFYNGDEISSVQMQIPIQGELSNDETSDRHEAVNISANGYLPCVVLWPH